jgi:hypothetical protein
MLSGVHIIVGGAAGVAAVTATNNIFAGLAAGIVSHFILDAIPHFDTSLDSMKQGELVFDRKTYIIAFTDSILAAIIMVFFWYYFFDFPYITPFILGAGGGYLPDFIDNVPWWRKEIRTLPLFKQLHQFHVKIHQWKKIYPMPQYWILGICTQIVFASAGILYLLG